MTIAFEPRGRPRLGQGGWTDQRIELATSLWLSGVSAGCIADELQGVTRAAVLGKLFRLGVARSVPAGLMLSGRRVRPRRVTKGPSKPKALTMVIVKLPDLTEPSPELAVTFAHLDSLHCRWIAGEPKGIDTIYCGAMKAGSDSYCAFHCRRVFNYAWRRVPTAYPMTG